MNFLDFFWDNYQLGEHVMVKATVTVNIWRPVDIKFHNIIFDSEEELQRSVGHASLYISLENRETPAYLSFWPEKTKKDKWKILFGRDVEGKFVSCDEDKKITKSANLQCGCLSEKNNGELLCDFPSRSLDEEEKKPLQIQFSIPKGDIIYEHICNIVREGKDEKSPYNLYKKNCATLVAKVLNKIRDIHHIDIPSEHEKNIDLVKNLSKYLFHNLTHNQIKFFEIIINTFTRQKELDDLVKQFEFKLSEPLYLIISRVGGHNPLSVQEYAKCLQKKLGG